MQTHCSRQYDLMFFCIVANRAEISVPRMKKKSQSCHLLQLILSRAEQRNHLLLDELEVVLHPGGADEGWHRTLASLVTLSKAEPHFCVRQDLSWKLNIAAVAGNSDIYALLIMPEID